MTDWNPQRVVQIRTVLSILPEGGYKTLRTTQRAITLPRVSILDGDPKYLPYEEFEQRLAWEEARRPR